MSVEILDDNYWSDRYLHHQTGWDLHKAAAPIKTYIDQLPDKNIGILIPGCGNAYEADYLLQKGFRNITLIDIAHVVVDQLKKHFSNQPIEIIQGDFFNHQGIYDLVLEQTFFCALDPSLREQYANKMKSLLQPGGFIAGVLFDRSFNGGPPFGGSKQEYQLLFEKQFQIKTLSSCYNSEKARQGTEVFFILKNA